MPTYTYQCMDCAVVTEEVRTIAKRNDTSTCECSGLVQRVQEIGYRPAFALKGHGWTPKSGGGRTE